MKEIGIFDPHFQSEGHFYAFNQYIAELCDASDWHVTFLQCENRMQEAYHDLSFRNPPKFISVASTPPPAVQRREQKRSASGYTPPSRFSRAYWKERIGEILWYRRVYKKIRQQNLDLVLITSEGSCYMYFVTPRFPFAAFVLISFKFARPVPKKGRLYIVRQWFQTFCSFLYKRFLHKARVRFTTNEPPMIPETERVLEQEDLHWLPQLYISHPHEDHSEPSRHEDKQRGTHFLTLGTILPDKNHAFILSTIEQFGLPASYTVAGYPVGEVGKNVQERIDALRDSGKDIFGTFRYLSSEEYQQFMKGAHFMILPYDNKRSNRTSQVMFDAFQYRIPIIAPNCEPFRWFVETYHVGFLYEEGDMQSCSNTLQKAAHGTKEDFANAFHRLEEDLSFDAIRRDFAKHIQTALTI